jgi:probable O-glycosylation ligase (exosortase A-associated)
MLRIIFIGIIVLVGSFYAFISPFYALLFYLWNAYFRPDDWIWWVNVASWHISLIVGVFVLFRTLISAPTPRFNLGAALVWLFLVQAIIGTITSEHPSVSAAFLLDFVKVIVISYLIVVLVTDRDKFRLTLVVIALSLGLEAAKQGWANLFLAPGMPNGNTISFLGDNNGVAVGLMMLVPVLSALARTAPRRWEKYAFRFISIGVFLRALTTYSRGGFLAAAVLGVFLIGRAEKKLRAVLAIGAIVALVFTVMPQEYWDRINTITAPADQRDESAQGRIHFWGIAVTMAKARPLTGVGLNGFEASYSTYDPTNPFGEDRATHSTWLGVLADLGVPGFLLLIANLVFAMLSCRRVARLGRLDPTKRDLRIYANALMTSLVVFAVGGTFLSCQYNEMIWHFFGLSTALTVVAFSEAEAKVPAAAPAPRIQPYAVSR